MKLAKSIAVTIAVSTATLLVSSVVVAETPREAAVKVGKLLAQDLKQDSADNPQADDEIFLKRAMLDIIGRLPTPEEAISFAIDPAEDKREKLVHRLLKTDEFGSNWARYWRDVILYRRTEERALLASQKLEEFLTQQLNSDTSWDKIATAFVTAEGDVREEGATALIMAQSGQPEDTVAEISRIFMGIQIQCAQCHDHPTDRWKREQFHQLAAFFPRVAVRPVREGEKRSFAVVSQDRFFSRPSNNNNRYRGTSEHSMKDLEKPEERGKVMTPVLFTTGESLRIGATDDSRRESLAKWMTSENNSWFAKAYVNRIWAELVGEGFYEPIDDIGPDRDCSAPQTMDYLAEQFVANDYDVKWLFETITATDAYQLRSQRRRNYDETPFQANCNQRLRADQLFSSLISVLGVEEPGAREFNRQGYSARFSARNLFNTAFGFDPSDPRAEVKASIPQALLMMNSPIISRAISARSDTGLGRLLRQIDDDEELITELYLRAYSRAPTDEEVKICTGFIKKIGNRGEAFEDILWSLINSTEFQYRR
ncbi:MAG: hypothetical protein ACI9G1_002915 [Pirellulaceae bacterium]|jgi:hypothetical protein